MLNICTGLSGSDVMSMHNNMPMFGTKFLLHACLLMGLANIVVWACSHYFFSVAVVPLLLSVLLIGNE